MSNLGVNNQLLAGIVLLIDVLGSVGVLVAVLGIVKRSGSSQRRNVGIAEIVIEVCTAFISSGICPEAAVAVNALPGGERIGGGPVGFQLLAYIRVDSGRVQTPADKLRGKP